MSVQEIEQALGRALGRRRRLAAARDAIAALTDDERDEILAELVERTKSSETPPEPPPAPEVPPIESAQAQNGAGLMTTTVTRMGGVGTGTSVVHAMTFPSKPTIRVGDAILDVMGDGMPRVTGEIVEAVKAKHPSINQRSVPSAVARLASEDPPQLKVQGKGKRGAPVYIIAGALQSEAKAKGSPGDDFPVSDEWGNV